MPSPEEQWRKLVKDGEVVVHGYVNPNQFVLDDEPTHNLIELYLSKKPITGDRKAIRVKVHVKVMSRDGDKETKESKE